MPRSPVQLVVFDLGGVLVRICRGWGEAFARAGIAEEASLLSEDTATARHQINRLFETGEIDESAMFEGISALTRQCTAQHVCELLDAWLIEPYAGVEQMLERLTAAGVATACLSNTNPRHWRTMMHEPRYAMLRKLHHRIASHLIGVMKPDGGAYAAVEKQTGVKPENILYFDDFPANCEAAASRGWRVHQIDHAGDPAAQMLRYLRHHHVL